MIQSQVAIHTAAPIYPSTVEVSAKLEASLSKKFTGEVSCIDGRFIINKSLDDIEKAAQKPLTGMTVEQIPILLSLDMKFCFYDSSCYPSCRLSEQQDVIEVTVKSSDRLGKHIQSSLRGSSVKRWPTNGWLCNMKPENSDDNTVITIQTRECILISEGDSVNYLHTSSIEECTVFIITTENSKEAFMTHVPTQDMDSANMTSLIDHAKQQLTGKNYYARVIGGHNYFQGLSSSCIQCILPVMSEQGVECEESMIGSYFGRPFELLFDVVSREIIHFEHMLPACTAKAITQTINTTSPPYRIVHGSEKTHYLYLKWLSTRPVFKAQR